MTRRIEIDLTLEDNDQAKDLFERWLELSGLAWTVPEAEGEPYKALKHEETGSAIIGTASLMATGYVVTDAQIVAEAKTVIDKIMSERNWYLERRQLPIMLKSLVEMAGREGDNAVREMKSALDNMIMYFHGMEIVVEAVLSASTHNEKDARLRGLLEVIQAAQQRATEFTYEFGFRHYNSYSNIFKSDFPTRDLKRALHEKDAEIKRLKIKAGEAEPEPVQSIDDGGIAGDQIIDPFEYVIPRSKRF